PLREFTIASDLVGMLTRIAATGSEARWVPFGASVRTPALLVSEMTVSGS
ncbi:MAG: PmbA/TldA metallopeptidase C-terminal domain, partial [Solirubrobacterales bacterium]|nr:PmbA/TldA metallopeptidase C-terminal domain [Solirubrobacterales bacterium]